MNQNNVPPYNAYAQQYGYPPPAVTYAPTQPPYPYPPPHLPQNLAQQQQQQQPQIQPQQAQPQYFQSLPQGSPSNPHSLATPQRQRQPQQQNIPGHLQDDLRSIPLTPGNGPGAPPPEPSSPPSGNYEQELMKALRQENEARLASASNNTAGNNPQASGNAGQEASDDEDEQMGDANDDDEDQPIYQLPPPPEAIYPDEITLEKAMHAWSLEHGYELVRRASKKNAAKQLYKRYFHCSKHGKVSHKAVRKEDRKRVNRTSNRMNCPMSLAAVAVDPHDPTGNWQIRHRKTHHNHPAIEVVHLAGHRRRARNPAVEAAVDSLFAIGTNVGDVLKFLQRNNPDGLFKRTDVANMKLKYKKFGTCAQGGDEQQQAGASSSPAKATTGAAADGDAPQSDARSTVQDTAMENSQHTSSATALRTETTSGNLNNLQNAEGILAALKSFQAEHVRPSRLTLESSSVEILAASTCGNGESYRSAVSKPFFIGGDYTEFKDAFLSAARKENTIEVLLGSKQEPAKPTPSDEDGGVSVEDHNEYIKQLAIYRRRDDMLKSGLRETVTKVLWSRISKYHAARGMWAAIEDLCMPRGSDQAFTRFCNLVDVKLQDSADLDAYVHELQTKFTEFNQLALHHEANRNPAALNQSNAEILKRKSGGDGTFPEEFLCFLLLKGLGPQYQSMAMNLCKRNNIGGYGSGERLTFKELSMLVKKSRRGGAGA